MTPTSQVHTIAQTFSCYRCRPASAGPHGNIESVGVVVDHTAVSSGEFDPGSGRTLAARLIHASRTGCLRAASGGRVSNTWVTCPEVGNNAAKAALIPHMLKPSLG